ncbi:iron ABC transporter permease [Geovibrio sp. ADMFC3]
MSSGLITAYIKYERRRAAYVVLLFMLCILAFTISLSFGSSGLSLKDSYSAVFGGDETSRLIIWELRIPRLLMAVLVGWGLAVGGTASQVALRNPLASPFTLGVSSGAAFGAVVVIMSGMTSSWLIAAAAFSGAIITTLIVLGIGRLKGASPESLVLAGVALMFLFSAMTSLLQYTATMQQVQAVVFWMFGSLANSGWHQLAVTFPLTILPTLWLIKHSLDFNLMTDSDETAKAFGINTGRLRITAMLCAALMCASSICFTGVIGFIGLVSPHIARLLLGSDHRCIFPASALIGASIVTAADTFGRTLWQPQVIPLGIMTSFIGVPFFIWLLLRKKIGGHP